VPSAYYQRLDADLFQPTGHAQGAWNDHEQHMAPVSGLLAHALERHAPRPGLAMARVTYEILGLIPLEPITVTVTVRTVRPGRTIELIEAEPGFEPVDPSHRNTCHQPRWRVE
jgi:hypothetical protein